eukprot:TRINITY_DN20585_c0_g1_i1.p2 TRINITY_DN20585_c0_g1~~TRINITY_DN20585_c0_g1_i1.p2  ORF type:complete len:340 (-),score=70.39 TRINITY_DN20585_c0_g1_i1:236-1168(-)
MAACGEEQRSILLRKATCKTGGIPACRDSVLRRRRGVASRRRMRAIVFSVREVLLRRAGSTKSDESVAPQGAGVRTEEDQPDAAEVCCGLVGADAAASTAAADAAEEAVAVAAEDKMANDPTNVVEEAAAKAVAVAAEDKMANDPTNVVEEAAAKAALAFLERVEQRREARRQAGQQKSEPNLSSALRSESSSRLRLAARHRVQFNLCAAVHEVTPYSEIYGLHPREFVFGRRNYLLPAAGPYGFTDMRGARIRQVAGRDEEEDEDTDDETDESDSDFCSEAEESYDGPSSGAGQDVNVVEAATDLSELP